MTKIRVYELAKEMNTTSKRLIEKLAEINIVVKNHMSLLEEPELEALYDHIGVIKHKEESDEKKQIQMQMINANERVKEARKEAKNAPRIIRTTEIIVDSDDEVRSTKSDRRSNNPAKKVEKHDYSKKKRNDYVKVSTSNSGLRPGFVRDPKPELLRPLEVEKKQEVTKIVNSHKKNDTQKEVSIELNKEATDKGQQHKTSTSSTEEVKVSVVNTEDKSSSKLDSQTKGSEAKSSEQAQKKDVNLQNKDEAKIETKPELKPTENAVQNNRSNNRDNRNNNIQTPKNNGRYNNNHKYDNQQRNVDNRNTTDAKTGNNRPAYGDRPSYNQNNRSNNKNRQGQGGKNFNNDKGKDFSPNRQGSSHNKPNYAASKPLDIPKVDPAAKKEEVTSQRSEIRREFSNKDMAKDSKRELKKEIPKTSIAKGTNVKSNKNTKPIKNVFTGKKEVSKILSDDFILQEFYADDVKKAKRPKKEVKKEEKYIPPRAVLTSIKIPETLTVKELAESLKKAAAEVIKKMMSLGILATVNQEIDFDTAAIIADEFGVKAEKEVVVNEEDILFDDEEEEDLTQLVPRPPVVVVMGHVDHGKTSLLDAIKSSHVSENEAGGITQHIGAYMVKLNNRNITFLDTPGHEAFTAMRARGAQVTDIAILVVAADDGVMPQTIEAINHAKAANVTIIVAINKIDKPGANPDRVKQELTEHGLVSEEWGGDTICVEVSAKKRTNIDSLLEMVLLAADMLELKANPNRQAKGTVIDAKLDKDKGPTATILVQRGTLNIGDSIVTGTIVGRIRAMVDDKGHKIKKAGPSTPVEILGLPEVPEAGEIFYAITEEKIAKQLVEKRKLKQREQSLKSSARVSLDDLFNQIKEGKVKELNIIVKADVQGSVEAVKQSLEKLSDEEVRVRIIHGGVGAVTESDVTLAQVSNAIIIGFNVRPATNVAEIAKDAGVDLRLYRIIYNAIEDIQAAMKGMLEPTFKEVVTGHIEVRQIFKVSGIGTIGGGYVIDGKVARNSEIRLVRDGIVVHEGKLASLKRFKDDVKEVAQGFECGFSIEKFNDIKETDVVEAFVMEEVKR
ncbi:MAG: translation initiation factor IF-2 [Clostridiaceae bacterium]|nr:translation initiation factor IF-2 [Clostridiaceae bacterium]